MPSGTGEFYAFLHYKEDLPSGCYATYKNRQARQFDVYLSETTTVEELCEACIKCHRNTNDTLKNAKIIVKNVSWAGAELTRSNSVYGSVKDFEPTVAMTIFVSYGLCTIV